jgi:predicted metal-dependent hydrolase
MTFEYANQLSFNFFSKPEKSANDIKNQKILHERRIGAYLSIALPETVDVRLTNNRTIMISYKKKMGRLNVRLHHMFKTADNTVLNALALYLSGVGGKKTAAMLDDFIAKNRLLIKSNAKKRKPQSLFYEGKYFNLQEVYQRVSDKYFENIKFDVKIGWSQGSSIKKRKKYSPGKKSRILAAYNFDEAVIKVNPVLDSPKVPEYVMDWVVYHELLHHVLPVEKLGKKRYYHTPKFRAMERAFDRYEDAKNWEKENIKWLVS